MPRLRSAINTLIIATSNTIVVTWPIRLGSAQRGGPQVLAHNGISVAFMTQAKVRHFLIATRLLAFKPLAAGDFDWFGTYANHNICQWKTQSCILYGCVKRVSVNIFACLQMKGVNFNSLHSMGHKIASSRRWSDYLFIVHSCSCRTANYPNATATQPVTSPVTQYALAGGEIPCCAGRLRAPKHMLMQIVSGG